MNNDQDINTTRKRRRGNNTHDLDFSIPRKYPELEDHEDESDFLTLTLSFRPSRSRRLPPEQSPQPQPPPPPPPPPPPQPPQQPPPPPVLVQALLSQHPPEHSVLHLSPSHSLFQHRQPPPLRPDPRSTIAPPPPPPPPPPFHSPHRRTAPPQVWPIPPLSHPLYGHPGPPVRPPLPIPSHPPPPAPVVPREQQRPVFWQDAGPSRPRARRNPTQAPREGKSDTITPPFPWATAQRATVYSLDDLLSKQITTITGEVQCKRCERHYELEYDLKSKFVEVGSFIVENRSTMHDRAPSSWMNPVLPSCKFCEQENSVKPIISEKKKSINWLFLLLGQMLGCCTLKQLKYFCKHTKNHRTGARDRVLYLTYLGLCKQLDPNGPFER